MKSILHLSLALLVLPGVASAPDTPAELQEMFTAAHAVGVGGVRS